MPVEKPSSSGILKATALVAMVGLAVAAVAVLPSGTGGAGNSTLFGDRAVEQVTAIDGINATVETVIERENGTVRSVEHVSVRPSTGKLRSVLRSSTAKRWDLRVSNGSVLWLYDRETNDAEKIASGTTSDGNGSESTRLARLFERIARSRTTATASQASTPAINPLPAVPHSGVESNIDTERSSRGSFDVRYLGNQTVDGRTTYVIQLDSQSASESAMIQDYTQRLWVDTEYFYPVKRRTAWRQDGAQTVITTTYRNVTFNPGLSDSLFTFEPPANATIDTDSDGPRQWTYGSLPALRSAATTSVPTPRLPRSFDLAVASRTHGRVRSVGLQYVNATAKLSISKSNLTWYQPRTDSDPVTVGTHDGEFRNLGPEQTVSWTCGDWRYSVTGSGLTKPTLVDIAESVSCE